jgi:tetratricopeptide (TPR) repeat protein
VTAPRVFRGFRRLAALLLACAVAAAGRDAAAQTAPAKPPSPVSAEPPAAATAKPATAKPAARPAVKRAATPTAPRDPRTTEQLVNDARSFEDVAAYQRALADWRALRPRVPLDGDLELAVAIDEARVGLLDSAAARLSGPVLTAAAADTAPASRYVLYGPERNSIYTDGRFTGWHWYVVRARAEVALARGRWEEGVEAARAAAAARPMSGKEWLLLAVCAGRAGHDEEARAAAAEAVRRDPSLPEAHYLDGLWSWRAGRRADAQASFRAATEADPTFRPAALALVRSRLPGAAPDTLPAHFLTGEREAAVLTSTVGPKVEHFIQPERAVLIMTKTDPVVPDSLRLALFRKKLPLWVLVDEQGRALVADVGWYHGEAFPTVMVSDLLRHLRNWTFQPAVVRGELRRVWVDILYQFAL